MSETTVSTPGTSAPGTSASPAVPAPRSEDDAATAPGGGYWRDELRPLLRRVHVYAGLFIGPFLLTAALTGLLYTITPQLEQWVHHDQLTVTAPPGARPLPLSAQVASATAALPGREVTQIRPAATPDGTTRVVVADPGVPEDYARTAFVDPYTGHVRGVLTTFGEWLPVRAWVDELHRTLHLGAVGRVYSELAASWLWVLVLSGLAVWLGGRWRARRALLPRVRGAGRGRLRSWHGAVGLWAAAGLLFLSATGLTWSQFAGDNVTSLRHALSWSTPTPQAAPLPGPPSTAPVAEQAQRALDTARGAGLSDPVEIIPPSSPGAAWRVDQTQRSWPEKQDAMAVDPATGRVLRTVRFADWPLAAKLARWGVDAHMGLLFGWVSQLALAALACGLACMVVWGYRMWWLRRSSVLREAPAPRARALLPLAVAAVAAGAFLPLLGASLLAFLLVDALRGARGTAGRVQPVGASAG